ncbi:MAG: chloride channel protein [Ruminococcus sp.]|nr:chloride channel protein [Ruminococcus sp.]
MNIGRFLKHSRIRALRYSIHCVSHLRLFIRWLILSLMTGLIIGGIGSLFALCMTEATGLRSRYPQIMFFMPIGGLVIVFLYRLFKEQNDRGTNMVIASIHAEGEIPGKMAPMIFVSTIITHLVGGSAGREGAALQIGGSLGAVMGRIFKMTDTDRRVLVMCGMSAVFSAGFGTPLAAAIFAMEIGSVGVMYYAALVPCTISSLTAWKLASFAGVEYDSFAKAVFPELSISSILFIVLLGVLCAAISVIFCITLHKTNSAMRKYLKNPYIRIVAASCTLIAISLILGNQDFLGAGVPMIENALEGNCVWYAFILKIICTAITIESGFKGGEIVPSFFIGATFGCLFGHIIGFSPELCAAVGMVSIFCGVTNCPLTSLLIAFELFGFQQPAYILVGVSVSYMLSGYYGLYHDQRIVYSKYETKYINRHTKS